MQGTNLTAKSAVNNDVTIILQNEQNLAAYIYTDGALPTDNDKYALGCICIKRSIPYGTYQNTSNGSTPNWFVFQVLPTQPFIVTGTQGVIVATGTQEAIAVPDGLVGQVLSVTAGGVEWTNAGAGNVVSTSNNDFTGYNTHTGTEDFTGATVTGIDKITVGLSNVDDTSDADKPISTATLTALNTKLTNSFNSDVLVGRIGSAGAAEEITLGDNLSFTGNVLNAQAITSLNGQTGDTQTFANDTNVTISSAGDVHTLGWTGALSETRGGTGETGYTIGDILYASSATTLAKLPVGANGTFLKVLAGIPSWQASVATGVQSINGDTSTAQLITSDELGSNVGVSTSAGTTAISIPIASASKTGKLSNTDWTIFNNKLSSTRNINTTSPILGGGDLSADRTISIQVATTAQNGYLSSTDWNTFNGKMSSALTNGQIFVGNASNIATGVAMSGEATITNTGVVTLSAVGSAGTYGTTTTLPVITTNASGRITNVTMSPIDHDSILNFVANKHINHTSVSIINGTGISAIGLGDITASRTINIDVASSTDRQNQTANKMLDATAIINEGTMVSNSTNRIPTQASVVSYVTSKLVGAEIYRGTMSGSADLRTTSTGNTYWDTTTPLVQGSVFRITSSGTLITNSGTVSVEATDRIILNADTTPGAVTSTTIDVVSGTENITSVFGRIGAVVSVAGDYTATQITNTPSGNISAVTVQAAITELDTEKISTSLASNNFLIGNGSGVAAAVTLSGDVTSTNAGVLTIGASKVVTSNILANNVTYAKIQQVTSSKILGNPTGSLADASEIGLSTGLEFNGTNLRVTASVATSIVNDTNVTGVVASNVLTLGWTGVLGIARGGTGIATTPANGELLIGNGTNYTKAPLTAGSGISVTNGAGSITLTNTGVTSLTGTTNQVNVSASTGGITLSTPQSIATTSTPTFAGMTLSPFTTAGLVRNDTSGTLSSFTGSSGQIIVASAAGLPTWVTISGDVTVSNTGVTAIGASKVTNGMLVNSTIGTTIGTTGTDITWSASSTALGSSVQLNVPDASATARGAITTGTQTIGGIKTFATAGTTMAVGTATRASMRVPAGVAPTTAVQGDVWSQTDSSTLKFAGSGGLTHSLSGTIFKQTATGTGGVSSIAVFNVSSTGVGTLVIPANTLQVGDTIRVQGYGTHQKGSGNLTLSVLLGATNIASTGSQNSGAAATPERYTFDVDIVVRTIGASGTVMALGNCRYYENTVDFPMGLATAQTLDTTVSQTISVQGQWAASSVNNILTLNTLTVSIL